MSKKFHNPIFERIAEEKRARILDVATEEFANRGFTNANINIIAEKAGVSIGSLYKYFETKEAIFLTTVHRGIQYLETILESILSRDAPFFDKIREIIQVIQEHSRKYPDLVKLYNEMTSEGNAELIRRLSSDMETVSSDCYSRIIDAARTEGLITSPVHSRILAFFLDNLFMTLQFSYACDYYKERMKIYLGPEISGDDALIVESLVSFLKSAFSSTD